MAYAKPDPYGGRKIKLMKRCRGCQQVVSVGNVDGVETRTPCLCSERDQPSMSAVETCGGGGGGRCGGGGGRPPCSTPCPPPPPPPPCFPPPYCPPPPPPCPPPYIPYPPPPPPCPPAPCPPQPPMVAGRGPPITPGTTCGQIYYDILTGRSYLWTGSTWFPFTVEGEAPSSPSPSPSPSLLSLPAPSPSPLPSVAPLHFSCSSDIQNGSYVGVGGHAGTFISTAIVVPKAAHYTTLTLSTKRQLGAGFSNISATLYRQPNGGVSNATSLSVVLADGATDMVGQTVLSAGVQLEAFDLISIRVAWLSAIGVSVATGCCVTLS